MRRRTVLAGAAALAAGAIAAPRLVRAAATPVKMVIPRDSIFVLSYFGAKDAGIFKQHDIDIDLDARPFAGFLAGLPSKECQASTYSGIDAIAKINQGLDWAIIGGGLTVFQEVIVKKESGVKTLADLKGKRVGVWSTGAGAFKAARVAIQDAGGLDVTKDATMVQVAPPALFKMLQAGQVDAMINESSFTVRAGSQPDAFRSVFSVNEYWKKKTGFPVIWAAPLVAWRSWVDEDKTRAKNFAAAVEESFRWVAKPENFDAAVKAHGELAGVTDPASIATYKKWLAEGLVFLPDWNAKVIAAEWQFLELCKRYGALDAVPSKEKYALTFGS
jgi:ABC-type nitrate/sulfonate/bicarbonate transport system substrate-binding protein